MATNWKYVDTLSVGDKTYVWSGDVRYNAKVTKIDERYIHTDKYGRFGRKSGKGIDSDHMHLASGAGER